MKLKRIIAPIVITLIMVALFVCYALLLTVWIPGMPLFMKIIGGIIMLALAGVIIWMFFERMKEIRSGEEDDLSKY